MGQTSISDTGSQQTTTVAVWSASNSDFSLSTTVISGTQLTAVVPGALLTAPGQAQISIQKSYFADDTPFAVSNSLVFTITAGSTPSVVPAADTLGTGGTRQFAAVGFADDSAVAWHIEEGTIGGTITPNGFYTAPRQHCSRTDMC